MYCLPVGEGGEGEEGGGGGEGGEVTAGGLGSAERCVHCTCMYMYVSTCTCMINIRIVRMYESTLYDNLAEPHATWPLCNSDCSFSRNSFLVHVYRFGCM